MLREGIPHSVSLPLQEMKSKCRRRHSKVSGKWMTLVNLSMGIWQPAQSQQLPYRYRSASLLLPKVNNRSLGPVSKNTHKHTQSSRPPSFLLIAPSVVPSFHFSIRFFHRMQDAAERSGEQLQDRGHRCWTSHQTMNCPATHTHAHSIRDGRHNEAFI